ncbi:MAG: bifunctional demethylmenaquinone methyltransferase/2-methoxy-6-polyprenyl-1,4-benzoquinol methylase UbiE [Muribaculaceae bacterium]|nr:bifunctional demethylmenaquinone methyltransferase/2-methoxy-6-polyprenyl-1,4-benzoquinol methylase UbiE [Muribaculaceae bacterium]
MKTTPDMPRAEEVKPYDAHEEKGAQVEQMFDSIAPAYDFMNNAMTFGLHRYWRNRALRMLDAQMPPHSPSKPLMLLDVACGTGDVTFHLQRLYGSGARIEGIDLSGGMLAVARQRLERMPREVQESITFTEGDCLALPYADNTFDAITVAYGVRNFADLPAGYAEIHRVLRPGGSLCVIELCEPSGALMRAGYRIYSRRLIPLVGRLVSGDRSAYTYLPQSIAACPQREAMTKLMTDAGFHKATYTTLFPGAIAIYLARK